MRKNNLAVAGILASVLVLLAGEVRAGDPLAGEYIAHLGGCISCHATPDAEEDHPFSGGLALKTEFGVFRVPNITPDPDTGIGGWSFEDFDAAMRQGKRPDGSRYYPAFPYTSYTLMTDKDLEDLWAFLSQVPAQKNTVAAHDLSFPWSVRAGLVLWQGLFFAPDNAPQPGSRGEYIATALSHCGECHTPRNALGATRPDQVLQGTDTGPHGTRIPSALPDWSASDFAFALEIGMLPDGDFFGSAMADVVANTTSKMTADDRQALVDYLLSLK